MGLDVIEENSWIGSQLKRSGCCGLFNNGNLMCPIGKCSLPGVPHKEVLSALGYTEWRVVYPKLVCHHWYQGKSSDSPRKAAQPSYAFFDWALPRFLGPKSAAFCSFSLRANHQDFQLRNLRIIEPNEVTPSGDKSVERGNNNFAYKLDGISQEFLSQPQIDWEESSRDF